MQESLFYVIAGAVAVLAAAALLIPLRVRLSAVSTAFGGYGELRFDWLFFAIRLPMRLHLPRDERPNADILRGDGRVRTRLGFASGKKAKSPWTKALRTELDIRRVRVTMHIGLEDAPGATAMLCGFTESIAESVLCVLLPRASVKVKSIPVFSQDALRLQVVGIARIQLGKLLRSRMRLGANKK